MFLFGHHIGGKLDAILRGIGILLRRTEHMEDELNELTEAVGDIETAVTEGTDEIKTLAAEVKANQNDPAAIAALADRLHTAATKMHSAVTDVTTPITQPADPGTGDPAPEPTGGDPAPDPEAQS